MAETGGRSSRRQPTAAQLTFGAIIAIIAAAVGILSGLTTIWLQGSKIVSELVRAADYAPIGTIVSSMLDDRAFAAVMGESSGSLAIDRKWVPADGRDVAGTEYAKLTGSLSVVDLSGVFLRGMGQSGRIAGSVEDDSTALPSIGFVGTTGISGVTVGPVAVPASEGDRYDVPGGPVFRPGVQSFGTDHQHTVEISGGGDPETRPVNVAVYYYIKVN